MTVEEARRLMGRAVLYSPGDGEPEQVVITYVGSFLVHISWRDREQRKAVTAGELMPFPVEGPVVGDPAAACQATINELAAELFRATPESQLRQDTAVNALRELNWAAGQDFEGSPSSPAGASRRYHTGKAVDYLHSITVWRAWDKKRSAIEAQHLRRSAREEVAAWREARDTAPALVYLMTHSALGAAKVAVSDPSGSRIAQHRRRGWELHAAFRAPARTATATEAAILRWWRTDLTLPSFLSQQHMPQGGWTETVALSAINLTATVARACELVHADYCENS